MQIDPKQEMELMATLWQEGIADDLVRYVMFVFPWGEKGTPLEFYKGPRRWQEIYLDEISQCIKDNKALIKQGKNPKRLNDATASGRGVGKSALVAWLTHNMLTCRIGSTTIITANTEPQLRTKTFPEINKWFTMGINTHWFETGSLSVRPAPWFAELIKKQLRTDTRYYYVEGQNWSEENPDAFAGAHNPLGIQVLYDEASGIPAPIWTVTEGFFTEPVLHRYWHVFSNPRRNSGGFYDCFHDHKEHWRTRRIDARTVEGVDPAIYAGLISKHGADSDEARVEVYGLFPQQGVKQFISNADCDAARERELQPDPGAPLVMGIDVARYGNDRSVIRWRQGRDGRSIPPVKLKHRDNVELASEIARWIGKTHPDAVNIDAGNGTGVIDILRHMGYRVHEVWFGSTTGIEPEWANKRTAMWAAVREWLKGGCIDRDTDLYRDLTAPEYDFYGKAKDKVILESKDSMRSRSLPSPDDGDAFALTFARPVARRDMSVGRAKARRARGVDYRVLG